MEKLKADIKSFEKKLPPDIGVNISEEQLKECSKYPFSLFSNKMSFLIGSGILHYDDIDKYKVEAEQILNKIKGYGKVNQRT